ncbi:hypothetical protein PF004_g7872 [Phytophthora fragariae]|uniref:Uncharacterized protein n=1 Tax=Phytophthora fragariae TaxID=53985 RepID=A0A6G0P8K6_9STRA|nr:hypothetical protein PF004_g7872 [Phytophthora fragariae]
MRVCRSSSVRTVFLILCDCSFTSAAIIALSTGAILSIIDCDDVAVARNYCVGPGGRPAGKSSMCIETCSFSQSGQPCHI